MGNGKRKQQQVWVSFVKAVGLSLGLYLAGQALLAALVVRGTVGEAWTFEVTAVMCFLCSMAGGFLAARHAPWGPLAGSMLSATLFAIVLIAVGALAWEGITWTGHGGILILCALAGGLPAGLPRKKRRGGKRRRR